MFSRLRILLPIVTMALVSPGSALAQKNPNNTSNGPTVIPGGTVTSTYVINQPGSYVLGGNRVMADLNQHILQINAADVTVDLAGFSLSYANGNGLHGVLIPATENVEIRNGTIARANIGVSAPSGTGLRVSNVRFAAMTWGGVDTDVAGAQIDRCQFVDAGGHGIFASGAGSLVSDCVTQVTGTGITVSNGSRVSRSTTRGGTHGIVLGKASTAIDCTATNHTVVAMMTVDRATFRNVEISDSAIGLAVPVGHTVFVTGSRITDNTTNVQGLISGLGNLIQ